MTVVAIVAGVLVGLAFLAAGVAKLVDVPAWARQAADLGVGRPFAVALPWVELIIGAALVSQLVRPWPAVVALGILLVFTAVIIRRLLDGSRPPCACFGTRSRRPLGTVHVVRNLGLLTLATVAALWG